VPLLRTSRPFARAALPAAARPVVLLGALLLLASPLLAQRHGGGGPGGGGEPRQMGGPMGNSFAGGSVSPMDNSNRRMGYGTPTSPIRIEPQLGPPTRWWDDKKTIKHLALRNDQKQRMDDIFEANRQQLATLLGNLQREEARLVSLPPGDLQDEGKVFAAIDRVSQARAELEKAHAHILLQIRQQMDSQQLATLDHDMASLR
jgi:Spy/CpxP family protein refolding chaperone